MPDKIIHICSNCQVKFSKWYGKCPSCQRWATLQECIDPNTKKQAKHIEARSKAGHRKYNELTKVKQEVSETAKRKGNYYCQGCGGICEGTLSHAHLIAESQDEINRLNPYNIVLMNCGFDESCHDRWDCGDIKQMQEVPSFYYFLTRIKKMNKSKYNAIVTKLNKEGLNKNKLKFVEL